MRYIIIPLLIGLCIWWSVRSIIDIKNSIQYCKKHTQINFVDNIFEYTAWWIASILVLLFIVFISFTVIYW